MASRIYSRLVFLLEQCPQNAGNSIHISDGKLHNVNVLDLLLPEPGVVYVMDRRYLDLSSLYALDQAGSFFVARARRNMNARRVYSAASITAVA